MAKSRAEIQRKSNEKHGRVARAIYMEKATAEAIKTQAEAHGLSQGELIKQAIALWQAQH